MARLRDLRVSARAWRIGAAVLIAAAGVEGCSDSGAMRPLGNVLTGIFFPISNGDTRTYRQTNAAGDTVALTQTVGAPTTVNGFRVFPMTTRNANGNVMRTEYYQVDNPTGIAWVGSDEGNSTLRLTPPLVTPLNLAPGKVVDETVSASGTGIFANVKTLTSVLHFEQLESVTVPAGTFAHCARVQVDTKYRDAAGAVIIERSGTAFLAPRVGFAKVISSLGTTNELTSANVGGTVIP
jgi:hypothetical protein